jgi:opacity protein-like surface antigen
MLRALAACSFLCTSALLAAGCAAPTSHAALSGVAADATLLRAPDAAPVPGPGAGAPADGAWTTGLIGPPPGEPSATPSTPSTGATSASRALVAASPTQDAVASDGATQAETGSSRHVTLLLGQRMLDEDDWDPVDEPIAAGVEVDVVKTASGDGYEFGVLVASDEDDFDHPVFGDVDVESELIELYGGYRHTFVEVDEDVQPYVGGGGTLIHADIDTDGGPGPSDDDTSLGLYVRAGVHFALSTETRLGIDYRHVFLTDVDIGAIDDADYDQLMMTLGFPF